MRELFTLFLYLMFIVSSSLFVGYYIGRYETLKEIRSKKYKREY